VKHKVQPLAEPYVSEKLFKENSTCPPAIAVLQHGNDFVFDFPQKTLTLFLQ